MSQGKVKNLGVAAKKVGERLAGMEKLPYLCTRKRETGSLNLSGLSLTLAPFGDRAVLASGAPFAGRFPTG